MWIEAQQLLQRRVHWKHLDPAAAFREVVKDRFFDSIVKRGHPEWGICRTDLIGRARTDARRQFQSLHTWNTGNAVLQCFRIADLCGDQGIHRTFIANVPDHSPRVDPVDGDFSLAGEALEKSFRG